MIQWHEFELELTDRVMREEAIGVCAIIGSHNIRHDVDVLMFKHPEYRPVDFFRSIHSLSDGLEDVMRERFRRKLLRFPRFIYEDEVSFLGGYEPGDLRLHMLSYLNVPQCDTKWRGDMPYDTDIDALFDQSYFIKGKREDLDEPTMHIQGLYDNMFGYMDECDVIHAHYPKELEIKKMNNLFRYVLKMSGRAESVIVTSSEEIRPAFYRVANLIDKVNTPIA